jgi:2-(1,2-epoxy-1,2-dihydrophenyl)acetyl-CoA isomerase
MSDTILYSVADSVATITLNRPRVMNALEQTMILRLREVCETVERDAAVRAVVIRGAGPAFLAGGDVAFFHANLPRAAGIIRDLAGELHHAVLALRRAPKPVLASVHGAVAGAGVSLMAAADLAMAAADATFTLAYSRIGASPDGGATHFLPRLVGPRKALELMLLSDRIDAQAALSLGLVNRVVPAADLEAETGRLAQRLASGATRAYAETKRLVNEGFERSLADQLAAEVEAFARCAGTRDFAEGVTAFVEKRKPEFKGD